MEIGITWTQLGSIIAIIVILFWLYKCIVRVEEDKVKDVEDWGGRYARSIYGIKGFRAATEQDVVNAPVEQPLRLGQRIPGEDSGTFDFILWPYEKIPVYPMRKIVQRETGTLSPEEKGHILWGTEKDTEVSIMKDSVSNHYRGQFTYEMHFDGLETGRKPPVDPKNPTIEEQKNAQNVKVRVQLNVTVELENSRDARYQEADAAKWLTTLHSVIMSCLNEVFACNSYTGISDIRGKKLDDVTLTDGKTFKGRINEQMLDVKHLGMKTTDLDFLDYEIMPESKEFLDALDELAKSEVGKQIATNKADANRTLLQPELDARKQLIVQQRDAYIRIRETKDVTTIEQAKALPRQLRTFAGTMHSPVDPQFNLDLSPGRISTEIVARQVADDANEDGKNQSKKGGRT
ncbi:MAG: hypothetical protein ACOYMZ_00060 [Minisyncoccia bacterium]